MPTPLVKEAEMSAEARVLYPESDPMLDEWGETRREKTLYAYARDPVGKNGRRYVGKVEKLKGAMPLYGDILKSREG